VDTLDPPLLVSDLAPSLVLGLGFAFGAVWGSFFNVAIYRWPREMSVVVPPSHCPSCGARVPAHLNLPILSYVLLRGRTGCCGQPLSPRYPLVELASAALCTALARQFVLGAPPDTPLLDACVAVLCYFWFCGGLLIATFVDLERMEIPDEVSLPGAALGLATAAIRPGPGAADAALGAGGAYLFIQMLFVWGYERLTGRRGMGEGDSKLLLMIGAFVGWRGALFALFAGAMQGLVVAVIGLLSGKKLAPEPPPDELAAGPAPGDAVAADSEPPPQHAGHLKVPFGPFLALGALEYLFFGDRLFELWFGLTARILG
jgi:leader peptidase (prepilin peptidase)/N-methyltransferase